MGWKGGSMLGLPAGKHGYPDPLGTPPLILDFRGRRGGLRPPPPLSLSIERKESHTLFPSSKMKGEASPPVGGLAR